MKIYLLVLCMVLYTHKSMSQSCSTLVLGRTTERLPSTNTNAFIQQELPINTVHQQCDYELGGVTITYPSGWFTTPPLVSVSIEPLITPLDPTVQYSTQIVSNAAGQTTIQVIKNMTSESCSDEGECAGVSSPCGVLPTCSGGSCVTTQEQMCNVTPDCNTCSSVCTDCNNSACSTTLIPGDGSLCTGLCSSGNFCIGNSFCNGVLCQGRCLNCASCSGLAGPGSECQGNCLNCNGDCYGTCVGSSSNCDGVTPTCTGSCQGEGECTSCIGDSYGQGTCLSGGMNGICNPGPSTNCEGLCEDCATGLCNGVPGVTFCSGVCDNCVGSCLGNMDTCSGTFTGSCPGNTSGGTWTGICDSCAGNCLGSVPTTGRSCLYSCNGDAITEEAAPGEVRVHVYAIANPSS